MSNASRTKARLYLEQLATFDLLIDGAQLELDRLRKIAHHADSVSVAKSIGLKTVDPETRFSDIQIHLKQEINRMNAQKNSFQKLTDEKLVSVIRYRYMDHMRWDDVAYEMGCSRKTIQLLHNIALDAIADILAAEKAAA